MEKQDSLQLNDGLPAFLDEGDIQALKQGKLSILLLSDIHLSFQNLKLLQNWHFEVKNKQFDFILLSGDLANVNHDKSPSKEEQIKAEADIQMILLELESFLCPTYYIPGNHDPQSLLLHPDDGRPVLTQKSTNLHNQWLQIHPDLGIISLGGSCKSYLQKRGDHQWNEIYFPFPYSSDDQFKLDIESLHRQVNTKQFILMTHEGPQGASTTQDKESRDDAIIHFGSPFLAEYIKNNEGKLICNIHGHCHEGSALDKIGNVKIINPGSLMFGEFGELELKERADGSWQVSQFNKHYLS